MYRRSSARLRRWWSWYTVASSAGRLRLGGSAGRVEAAVPDAGVNERYVPPCDAAHSMRAFLRPLLALAFVSALALVQITERYVHEKRVTTRYDLMPRGRRSQPIEPKVSADMGIVEIAGTTDMSSDLMVNVDKFTVAAATGNVIAKGTLDVDGDVNLGLGNFKVNTDTGNVEIAGTLNMPIDTQDSDACITVKMVEALETLQDTQCAFFVSNPSAPIAMLKVTTAGFNLSMYSTAFESWKRYALLNGYAFVVYRASKDDWKAAGDPHFSKIAGIMRALQMGYEWVLFTDLDTFVLDPNRLIESFIDASPKDTSLILQDEVALCSCVLLWKNTPWSAKFLARWMATGEKHDCKQHSFDQIAFWGALMEPTPTSLKQAAWRTYCQHIRENPPKQVHLTKFPLHSDPWNSADVLENSALLRHTGHENWNPLDVEAKEKRNQDTIVFQTRNDLGHILNNEGMRTGVELGVKKGDFAHVLLSTWHSASMYVLVDVWHELDNYTDIANVHNNLQEKFYKQALENVRPFQDRGGIIEVCRNYTTVCKNDYPDRTFDFVYIDARHDYKAVYEDMVDWWPKLRSGGIFAGHDYVTQHEGPDQTGQNWTLNYDGTIDTTGTVVKGAVNQFAEERGLLVTQGTKEHWGKSPWPSWAIRKPRMTTPFPRVAC